MQPKVIDNDKDEITASLGTIEIRSWSYANDTERRAKMLQAWEYVGGWGDGAEATQQRLKNTIDIRLNNCLCEMKEGYDDSIVGFNEAWDIVRGAFSA